MAKQKYTVLTAVEHDGKRYEPDAQIALEANEAAPLIVVKAISAEPIAEPVAKK